MSRTTRRVAALAAAGGLAAGLLATSAPASAGAPAFRLQLLHASDLEGSVEAIVRAPNFAAIVDKLEDEPGMGASITLSAGDNYIAGPFFSAAGDSSIRPVLNRVYNALFGVTTYDALAANAGRVDMSIMNVIGFDASALGNHEFDLGPREVRNIVEPILGGAAGPAGDGWVGPQFPYLSANLDFSLEGDLNRLFTGTLFPSSAYRTAPNGALPTPSPGLRKFAPYTMIEENGQKIGVVGATTPLLKSISSPGATQIIGPTTNDDLPALAAVLQPRVDQLTAAGANKIVLVSHLQQVQLEQELAGLLRDVDVIVAGGSDTILANGDDALNPGDTAAGAYPFLTQSASGDPVAVVSTDGEYSYVGRLVVDFDAAGVLVAPDGSELDSVDDLDLGLNGPVQVTPEKVTELWAGADAFAPGTKGQLVDDLVGGVEAIVIAKDSNVIGESAVFLDGRRNEVRTQETALGNISADANLFAAQQLDPSVQVSIKNGGGIRAEIGEVVNEGDTTLFLPPQANELSGKLEGQVSQLDIENSLRFNNSLTVLTVTAAGLEELMEHAVAATAPGQTPGQFPQIGGMAFAFDATRAPRTIDASGAQVNPGDRVRSLVVGEGANRDVVVLDGVLQGDPNRPIRVATLNFLAGSPTSTSPNGGDNYPFPKLTLPGSRVDLTVALTDPGAATFSVPGSEQDALAEYLAANHAVGAGTPYAAADTPPSEDLRTQNLAARNDAIEASVIDGTPGADRINGTFGDDIVYGFAGNDRLDGKEGHDYLVGGEGNDELRGNEGDDVLIGNAGDDTYFGGDGADRIVVIGGGSDTVFAFDVRMDILDFQGTFVDAGAFARATTTVRGSAVVRLPGGAQLVVQGRRAADLVPGVNVRL